MALLTFFGAMFVDGVLSGIVRGVTGHDLGVIAFAFPFVVTALVLRGFGAPHFVIGQDGVRIHRFGRLRFVPRADIASVEHVGGALILHRRRGRKVVLPIIGAAQERVAGVLHRLRQTRNEEEGGARVASLLARGGRSVAEWRTALAGLSGREVGFRDVAVGTDDLARVLDDASAAPELRVGAALALRDGDPAAAARIRIAADTTAEEGLREALAAIAADEPAPDSALERVSR
jgi:hypothetical protein